MNSLYRIAAKSIRPAMCRIAMARYSTQDNVKERIDGIVKGKKLVVFMKGTPEQPMCGFSKAVVQILNMHGVENFEAHDVLEDEDIRQGVKEYSDWPTIPQVYVNGEFMGGCDIMLSMHQNGDLIEKLKEIEITSALLDDTPADKQG